MEAVCDDGIPRVKLHGLRMLDPTPNACTIGSVGGQKQPPVDRYIAGYQAGALKADPNIKLLNSYSNEWVDQAKCKQLALNQISDGADIVFQVAGGCGLGVLDAAKEQGVWGIGVDADQSYLGPQVLTSALKRVDTSVYSDDSAVLDGKFAGGTDSVFSLKNDGVGLGKISPKVPKADVEKVQELESRSPPEGHGHPDGGQRRGSARARPDRWAGDRAAHRFRSPNPVLVGQARVSRASA
jgi:basic membrane lipoprotein Med (substrate-binding protein (PBP1-ABC) superfamily)